MTLNISDSQHKRHSAYKYSSVMLKVLMMSHFIDNCAECHYAECRYAECRYSECRYDECRYAECSYAETFGHKDGQMSFGQKFF